MSPYAACLSSGGAIRSAAWADGKAFIASSSASENFSICVVPLDLPEDITAP